MELLYTLITDFEAITNDEALSRFLEIYALRRVEEKKLSELARHSGTIEGNEVLLTHTWYNPNGAFSSDSDMNELELLVNGTSKSKVKFSD